VYDDFSADYDRFMNWEARLAGELPFIERVVGQADSLAHQADSPSILDAACGTGMHAIALARRGYRAAGADASAGMIERARANAAEAGVDVRFDVATFGGLHAQFGGSFDAVLCLGNSLPHLLTPDALTAALADFAACLRPGGLILIQNRNFDAVLSRHERWMDPQAHREGDQEWLFLRFYDFDSDGLLTFNMVRLLRSGDRWEQQVMSTRLWPLRQAELADALRVAGFTEVVCWGDMQGAPFYPEESPNLVIGAHIPHLTWAEVAFFDVWS